MKKPKKTTAVPARPLARRVRYSVDGIAERPDVRWWVPENDFDKALAMLELALELLPIAERAQDDDWYEKYNRIVHYMKPNASLSGAGHEK